MKNKIYAGNLLSFLLLIILTVNCFQGKRGEELSSEMIKGDPVVYNKKDSVTLAKGKALFHENCSACHSTSSELVVGPGLAKIEERLPKEQIYRWIWNSQELIMGRDPYAIKLYDQYRQVQMPAFVHLKEGDIDAILYYIKSDQK